MRKICFLYLLFISSLYAFGEENVWRRSRQPLQNSLSGYDLYQIDLDNGNAACGFTIRNNKPGLSYFIISMKPEVYYDIKEKDYKALGIKKKDRYKYPPELSYITKIDVFNTDSTLLKSKECKIIKDGTCAHILDCEDVIEHIYRGNGYANIEIKLIDSTYIMHLPVYKAPQKIFNSNWSYKFVKGDELKGTNDHYVVRYDIKDFTFLFWTDDDDTFRIITNSMIANNYRSKTYGLVSEMRFGFYNKKGELVDKFSEILKRGDKYDTHADFLEAKRANVILNFLRDPQSGYLRILVPLVGDTPDLDIKVYPIFKEVD